MSNFIQTNYHLNEEYYCYECEADLAKSELKNWRCSSCGERVSIHVGLSQPIMRKLPREVTDMDYFLMKKTKSFLQVLAVDERKGTFFYNLKGHGGYPQMANEWVSCRYRTKLQKHKAS